MSLQSVGPISRSMHLTVPPPIHSPHTVPPPPPLTMARPLHTHTEGDIIRPFPTNHTPGPCILLLVPPTTIRCPTLCLKGWATTLSHTTTPLLILLHIPTSPPLTFPRLCMAHIHHPTCPTAHRRWTRASSRRWTHSHTVPCAAQLSASSISISSDPIL